jgi:hypothetical protein
MQGNVMHVGFMARASKEACSMLNRLMKIERRKSKTNEVNGELPWESQSSGTTTAICIRFIMGVAKHF